MQPRGRRWAYGKAHEAGGAERSRRLREHPIRRVQRSQRSDAGRAYLGVLTEWSMRSIPTAAYTINSSSVSVGPIGRFAGTLSP